MKKLFQKLVFFAAISFFLNSLLLPVHAEGIPLDQELNEAFFDIQSSEDQCVNPDDEDNYIITYVEEPIIIPGESENNEDVRNTEKDFIKRTCYRNTLYVNSKNDKPRVFPELAKKCSDNAAALAARYEGNEDIKILFSCQEITVLLSKGGTTLIEGYISIIYKWGASIAGIIAVLVIVISGIQLSASGGESQALEDAKKRIFKALAGLALLFLSGLLLYTLNPNFFTAGS